MTNFDPEQFETIWGNVQEFMTLSYNMGTGKKSQVGENIYLPYGLNKFEIRWSEVYS